MSLIFGNGVAGKKCYAIDRTPETLNYEAKTGSCKGDGSDFPAENIVA